MKELKLDTNCLSDLPESVGAWTKLTYLHLQNNKLRWLPRSLSNMTSLVQLDATNNSLASFPTQLPPQLSYLYLSENPVNATATAAAELLSQTKHQITSAELSFSSASPFVGTSVPNHNYCSRKTRRDFLRLCLPNVELPTDCRVGASCTFRLKFFDSGGRPVR